MLKDRIFISKVLTVFFILMAYTFLFYDHLTLDIKLSRDDQDLIQPLLHITNLAEYADSLFNDRIKDLQPIRDLTLFLNVFIEKHTSISLFHFTNMLFTLGILLFFYKIMRLLLFSEFHSIIFTTLLALHPILVSSIGWISARKHSLAILFILWAIFDLLKKKEVTLKTNFLYFLSIFSHPIALLFPAWCLILNRLNIVKNHGKKTSSLFIILIFCLSLNLYKFVYLGFGNTAYVSSRSIFSTISTAVLSLGRSVSLIFVPSNFSAIYFEGSIHNMIGLILLGLIILLYKKFIKIPVIIQWISLFVLINATYLQYFVNDTYLYLPLITQIILCAYMLVNRIKSNNQLLCIGLIIGSFYLYQGFWASKMWLSDTALWYHSYQSEGSPQTAVSLGVAIRDKEPKLSFELFKDAAPELNFRDDYKHLESICYFTYKNTYANMSNKIQLINSLLENYHEFAVLNIFQVLLYLQTTERKDLAIEKLENWSQNHSISNTKLLRLLVFELQGVCIDQNENRICSKLEQLIPIFENQITKIKVESNILK